MREVFFAGIIIGVKSTKNHQFYKINELYYLEFKYHFRFHSDGFGVNGEGFQIQYSTIQA